MFAIQARFDGRDLIAARQALDPKQWAFATALTLTRLGQRVEAAERETMQKKFDRPTPFTLNSLRLQPATKTRLEARVWFKDPPRLTDLEHYLIPEVSGGDRPVKRFERSLQRAGFLARGHELVPAFGAPRDAYGNVSRGFYSRLYSQLKASPVGANETARSRGRKGAARGGKFFYGNPGNKGRGIWERFGFSFGSAVRPVFLEVREASYKPIFPFFDIAEQTVGDGYQAEFARSVDETMRTAK
jgi:hypothetical protein